jgi:hypothetical protein
MSAVIRAKITCDTCNHTVDGAPNQSVIAALRFHNFHTVKSPTNRERHLCNQCWLARFGEAAA